MKQAAPIKKNKSLKSKPRSSLSYTSSITLTKSNSDSASQYGQQLALVINELLKSGELK